MKLSVAQEFTPYPAGRYPKDGDFSGAAFRDNVLIPAFENARKNNDVLEVSLDGVKILGSSFLEEAFGGMVRQLAKRGVDFAAIRERVKITASADEYDHFIKKTNSYMEDARRPK